jgi:hypothetical protein
MEHLFLVYPDPISASTEPVIGTVTWTQGDFFTLEKKPSLIVWMWNALKA